MHTSSPNVPSMVLACARGWGVVRSRSAQHTVQGLGTVLAQHHGWGEQVAPALDVLGVWCVHIPRGGKTNVTKQHVYACGGFLGV